MPGETTQVSPADPVSEPQATFSQCTQDAMDPRRTGGRNNSGLCAEDVSDVMCILHPATPAAYNLVADTASRSPQHILQPIVRPDDSNVEEQETFIVGQRADLDLALRFSSTFIQPRFGFVLGRNAVHCDVVVSHDAHKRVSNVHFRIWVNESGVLMLTDHSTNGTVVDDVVLRGKDPNNPSAHSRMLVNGSIVQLLAPEHKDTLRFIVRIPSRDGHQDEYEAKFRAHYERAMNSEARWNTDGRGLRPKHDGHLVTERATSIVKAPIIRNQFGMHWNGGSAYNVVGLIGKGAFASVYQLATKSDGRLFAAKELEKRKFMKHGILDRKLDNEMKIMQQINHPHIVQYVDYQDQANHLYIIMEFVAYGDLQQHLTAQQSPLPEKMAKQMAEQVFDGLGYLHQKKITHRDIKPDNLLISNADPDDFKVKLSDFGLSKVVQDNDTFLKTFCGTLLYCAPEVFPHYDAHMSGKGVKRPRKSTPQQSNKGHLYSCAIDIWSFGAVLWFALCLKPPFEGVADNTGRGMFDQIMMTPLDASDLKKAGVSSEAVSLLVKMLNTTPGARPTPQHCLNDAWFGHEKETALPPQGLGDIVEEEEDADEPDVASLSVNEQHSGSYNSEVSMDSGDLDFFDPRKSKRFKADDLDGDDGDEEEEEEQVLKSSPELGYRTIPVASHPGQGFDRATTAGRPKLFGEISQSNLQPPTRRQHMDLHASFNGFSSDSASDPPTRSSVQSVTQGAHDVANDVVIVASPSLLGAESLVRDMHMELDPPFSNDHDQNASQPKTPVGVDDAETAKSLLASNDLTPKPRPEPAADTGKKPKFDRRIQIKYPASYYYDSNDPSTHNIEYSIAKSGHDYYAEPLYIPDQDGSAAPTQAASSTRSKGSDPPSRPMGMAPAQLGAARPMETVAKYGRLISTTDSFVQLVLDLNTRITKWGRRSSNTHVYPNSKDSRIAREALILLFHARGIQAVDERGGDWTGMEGLHCEIITHSSLGLRINGVLLEKRSKQQEEEGWQPVGRIHTGDVIEVCRDSAKNEPGLRFVVEIYYGQGKEVRDDRVNPFEVEFAPL